MKTKVNNSQWKKFPEPNSHVIGNFEEGEEKGTPICYIHKGNADEEKNTQLILSANILLNACKNALEELKEIKGDSNISIVYAMGCLESAIKTAEIK